MRWVHGKLTQEQTVKRLGIGLKKWHHYEGSDGKPVSRETYFLIRLVFPGFPADWIWFGDDKYMDADKRALVKQAEKELRELDEARAAAARKRKYKPFTPHRLPRAKRWINAVDKRT